jgi:Terminase large subunit, T4likevirus-type, N-terminal
MSNYAKRIEFIRRGARRIWYIDPPDENGYYWDPFDWQRHFHRSKSVFKGFSGPVGSGKSQALCFEALSLAYTNRDCTGVVGAPTYPMLRDATFTSFRYLLDSNGVPYKYLKSENSVYLPEANSKILFRSLDNFERIRGTNLAWFGIDELTYCKPEAWLRLEGRLRDRKAKRLCGFASWTPKGFDWVYDRFIGADKKAGHEAFFAKQNITLPGFYDRLKSSYNDRFYKQEALGEYLNVFAGQAYYSFSREAQVRELKFHPHESLWWALDFNVNPLCSVIGQTYNGIVRVLDEMILPNSNTLAACEEFMERTKPYFTGTPVAVYIYGDASGGGRHTSATRTDWQIVKDFFGRYPERFQVQFRIPSANGPVKDRINCVNSVLLNHAGQRRMVLHTSCKELGKDFEQLAWKTDPNGNPLVELDKRDPARSHVSDALGYMISREFPMREKRGEMGGRQVA